MDEAVWAYCGFCRAWLYSPDWFDRDQPVWRCPGCALEPVAVERRSAQRAWSSQRRARERCRFCAGWADCNDWEDRPHPRALPSRQEGLR